MYKFLLRNGTTAAFVVGFLASILILVMAVNGGADLASDDFDSLMQRPQFNTVVSVGTIFVYIGLAVIILGGLYGLITNPKGSLKFLIGLVVLLVVVGIFYSTAKEETSGVLLSLVEQYDIKGTISKLISGGIMTTLILLGLAFITVLLAEVRNAFK